MNLFLEEQRLELDSIDEGVANYRRAVEARPIHELTVGKRIIRRMMTNLVIGIEAYQEEWLQGIASANSRNVGPIIAGIPAPDLALITLSTVYSVAFEGATFTAVAGEIGNYVDRYLKSEQMRQIDRDKYKKAVMKFKNINPRKFGYVVKHFSKDIVALTHSQKMQVGAKLMGFCIEYTDSFDYFSFRAGKKIQYMFHLKPEVRESIEKEHDDLAILRPVLKPMVVRPQDWKAYEDGGYLFHQNTLIKAVPGLDNDQLMKQRGDSIKNLFPYINLLQQTAYQINPDQLSVLKQVADIGGGLAGIPRRTAYPFPPKPVDIETNEVSRQEWKVEAAMVYTRNNKLAGQNVAFNGIKKLAEEFAGYEAFFQEWTADFRLRAYPSCITLSPQSSDIAKGLQQFSRGVALGDHGYKWLSIALASSIGEDKLSYKDRVAFVHDHEQQIIESVKDPLNNTYWMQWDEPFQGLLTAREWVLSKSDKTGFVSHVPVGVDGTCNGYQHYAALGRDPIVGKYTNLLPSDKPESIYTYVANAAILINEADCANTPVKDSDGDLSPCHCWVGHIGKPLVKQPTMTTPYSVTPSGILDQIYSNIDLDQLPGHRSKNLKYAQNLVIQAIEETATSATDIMRFLREIAYASSKANTNLIWTCPIGVKVVQRYPKFSESSFYTEFHRVYWRDPRKDTKEKISSYKHCNAVCPNFIHNLDACHMYMTTMEAHKRYGIVDFATAHDKYCTHAGHMEVFKPLINEQFVKLHSTNWLEKLYTEVSTYLDVKDVMLPKQGNLDINDVLRSDYFFH